MLGNGHVRFGRRAAETDQSKDRHRAAARPHTEHPTREGKVYCCVVLDTFSRRVVGWSIDASPTAALVTNALGMAIDARRPQAATLIHSDQGRAVSSRPGPSPTGRRRPGLQTSRDGSCSPMPLQGLGG